MALYTAAAMHDYDHPGRTNAFLVSTSSPLVGSQLASSSSSLIRLLSDIIHVHHSDYNSLIRTHSLKKWQLRWKLIEAQNKLHAIEARVNVVNLSRLPRRL